MSASSGDSWWDRLAVEQLELATKINRLMRFIIGNEFDVLTEAHKQLLREQLQHMIAYERVLIRRLALRVGVNVT